MARPEPASTVLRPRGVLDIETGEILDGACVLVEGNRIRSVESDRSVAADADEVIDLPDLTLTQDVRFVMKDGQVHKR